MSRLRPGNSKQQTNSHRLHRMRPRLESLESRYLLDCTFSIVGDTYVVEGTSNTSFTLNPINDKTTVATCTEGSFTTSFSVDDLKKFTFEAGAGDNSLSVIDNNYPAGGSYSISSSAI